jgi:hypothetical protein
VHESASLLDAALSYQVDVQERRDGTYLPPGARAKSWKKVADLCAQLREALETASRNRFGETWREEALCILPQDLAGELARAFQRRPLSNQLVLHGKDWTSLWDPEALAMIEQVVCRREDEQHEQIVPTPMTVPEWP